MHHIHRLSALAAAAWLAGSAHAADWSDTSVGLRYGNRFAEPGISDKIAKSIFNITHVSGDKLGTNLIIGDVLMSDSKDPEAGGGGGAQEFYGIFQRSFSLAALTAHQGGYGFAKDIALVGRLDLSSKNTAFAPRVRKLRVGGDVSLPVPAGFWTVGLQVYHESNHNGIVGKDVNFDTTGALVSAWAIPVAGMATFGGFLDVVGPKGKDGFGADTKTETVLRTTLMFDVGGAKSGVKAGIGWEYWRNKFGNDAGTVPGSKQSTGLLLAEYHF